MSLLNKAELKVTPFVTFLPLGKITSSENTNENTDKTVKGK